MSQKVLKSISGTDTWLNESCLLERVPLSNFSILWKWLRKRLPEPSLKRTPAFFGPGKPISIQDFSRWVFPPIKNMGVTTLIQDIASVQPMTEPIKLSEPFLWRKVWWACCRAAYGTKDRIRFVRFLFQRKPGDEFWHFSTDEWSWMAMAGRAGYLILRQNQVVCLWITRLS